MPDEIIDLIELQLAMTDVSAATRFDVFDPAVERVLDAMGVIIFSSACAEFGIEPTKKALLCPSHVASRVVLAVEKRAVDSGICYQFHRFVRDTHREA